MRHDALIRLRAPAKLKNALFREAERRGFTPSAYGRYLLAKALDLDLSDNDNHRRKADAQQDPNER